MPDAEAHVMPDGRLYLYGSWDLSGNADYCSGVMHTFSTDDMVHFTDHGVIFENTDEHRGMPWSRNPVLYAPDAIHRNGKYYLYVCSSCGEEGVAVADHPSGPFSDAEPVAGADGRGIDPAIFVDDDGQAYYLWGQFSLHGGKLADDMKSIIPGSEKTDILTETIHHTLEIGKRSCNKIVAHTGFKHYFVEGFSHFFTNNFYLYTVFLGNPYIVTSLAMKSSHQLIYAFVFDIKTENKSRLSTLEIFAIFAFKSGLFDN